MAGGNIRKAAHLLAGQADDILLENILLLQKRCSAYADLFLLSRILLTSLLLLFFLPL